MKKLFVPVLVVIAIGLAFFSGVMWQKVKYLEKGDTQEAKTPTPKPSLSLDTVKGLFKKDVIKFGDENSKVIFVEAADPSCPYCHVVTGKNPELNRQVDTTNNRFKLVSDGGKYQAPVPEMKKLVTEGKASYIYIYSVGHGNGEMGMKAFYCGFEKGKFWEVHDLLMTNKGYSLLNEQIQNDKEKASDLEAFLKSAVDPGEMESCLKDTKWDSRLTEDQKLAQSLGVQGTPSFFVNTTNFPGAYGWTDIKTTVDSLLK